MNTQTHFHSQVVARTLLNRPTSSDPKVSEAELAKLPREQVTDLMVADVTREAKGKPDVYLSTPITGGTRLFDFLAEHHKHSKAELSPEELGEYKGEVVKANCSHAHAIAEELRHSGRTVVEPSNIGMPGWTQTSYNENWTEVVHDLPLTEVRVCDGWQLSYGCLLEVRSALDKGLPVLDEAGHRLDRQQALGVVNQAVQKAGTAGFQLQMLPTVLTAPIETLPMEQPL